MNYRGSMRLSVPILTTTLLLAAANNALAVPASELKDNYQPIVDRNPFGLRPPPPPPTNNAAPVKEKPKTELYLTGITSIGYPNVPKKAYLMTKEAAGKKEPTYYALSEGVEQDGIKVLSIDDAGRKVRVHTPDEGDVLLSFQTHGVPPPIAPAAAKPGVPGQPIPGQPGTFPVPQPGVVPQPANHITSPTPYPTAQPVNTGVNASGLRQIPSRRVRAGMDNGMTPYVPNVPGGPLPGANGAGTMVQPEMDPAEQYVRMHLNRAAAEQQGIHQPPLPTIGQ